MVHNGAHSFFKLRVQTLLNGFRPCLTTNGNINLLCKCKRTLTDPTPSPPHPIPNVVSTWLMVKTLKFSGVVRGGVSKNKHGCSSLELRSRHQGPGRSGHLPVELPGLLVSFSNPKVEAVQRFTVLHLFFSLSDASKRHHACGSKTRRPL